MLQNNSVLIIGELLWDCFPDRSVLGGAPANVAFRLHELGRPITLVSRVGNDALGERAAKELDERSVNTAQLQVDANKPTGTVQVMLNEKGDAHYVINKNVAYDFIEVTPELVARAKDASLFCFGTLILRNKESRHSVMSLVKAAANAKILVDINLRAECYTRESVFASLEIADIAKLNEEEAVLVGEWLELKQRDPGELCEAVAKRFDLDLCLVTMGGDGGVAYGRDGNRAKWQAPKVQVVDTVGAGDAFTAAFIHAYLAGCNLQQACELGAQLGSQVAGTRGGMTPLPEFRELANKIF